MLPHVKKEVELENKEYTETYEKQVIHNNDVEFKPALCKLDNDYIEGAQNIIPKLVKEPWKIKKTKGD